jgi:glycerophosphoryl diester phosphodiesterase
LEKRVLFSSFSPIAVKKTRELAPEIPSGLILHPAEPRWLRGLFRALTSYEAWHPEIRLVTKELVEREHARGRTVNVWVVNEAEKMAEMIALGVDGLITDAPDVAEAFLRELNHRVNTNDPRNR